MIAWHWNQIAGAASLVGGMALFGHKKKPKGGGAEEEKAPSSAAAAASPAPETAGQAEPPQKLNLPDGLYAVFETSMGRIVCRLFSDQAPVAVQNFIDLARGAKKWRNEAEKTWEERPYYHGLTFHRVIPKFMIQGGDYMGNGTGGVGFTFEDEFASGLAFDRPGRLAMANAGPNTNGAQFFITVEATPWLDRKHTIFGEVAEGQEVATAISQTPRDVRDRPLQPVRIRGVFIADQRAGA